MKKTLVFGASLKTNRYSNLVVARLRDYGINTVAFGPVSGQIHGIPVTTHTTNIADIDTITLYMNPQRQKDYYSIIIDLKPQRVIFNPGTENPEFYQLLKKDNIEVEEACTLTLLATGQF